MIVCKVCQYWTCVLSLQWLCVRSVNIGPVSCHCNDCVQGLSILQLCLIIAMIVFKVCQYWSCVLSLQWNTWWKYMATSSSTFRWFTMVGISFHIVYSCLLAFTNVKCTLVLYDQYYSQIIQCFDAVGWASGRASNWVMRCWCGYLSGAKCRLFACGPAAATAIPKPHLLLPHFHPDWFYLSGTGFSSLAWKKAVKRV